MQFKDKRIYVIADSEKKKAGPPRIALGDYKSARHSLARILRMYFRKELDTEHFRNLCYALNILLSYDKFDKENELERRLTELENKRGQFSIRITPEEMSGLDPNNRDKRILELLEKAGYTQAETPQAEAIPDPVPAIPELPEQPQPEQIQPERPQPRRLKL
jgi:hypothetical protein